MPKQAEILKQKFIQEAGLPFASILDESEIQGALEAEGIEYRQRIYTPFVVIWSLISQALDPDKTLSQAMERIRAWLASQGIADLPSLKTAAYAQARERMPESVLSELVYRSGQCLDLG